MNASEIAQARSSMKTALETLQTVNSGYPLPDMDLPRIEVSEAEAAQLLALWTAEAQSAAGKTHTLCAGLRRLRDDQHRLAAALDREITKLEAKALLQDPDNKMARKAYDASRVMLAVKDGLVLESDK